MTSPQENLAADSVRLHEELFSIVGDISRRHTVLAYLQYRDAMVKVLRASGFLTPENEDAILTAIEREVYS